MEGNMHRLFKFLPAMLLLFFLVGCGGGGTSNTTTGTTSATSSHHLKFYVITHGQASDPFWSVIKRGVDQGAKDMGAQAIYEAPPTFDVVAQSHLIDSAVAAHPDGIVVSIPEPNALGPSIKAAIAAGIPVISINAGAEVAKSLGILVHVGQAEVLAGLAGGQKMGAAGVKHALCVNQQVGVGTLEQRCKGFTDGMKQFGATVKEIGVNGNNPTQTQQTIEAAIQHDPTIDGVMALGPQGSLPAIKALQDLNKAGQIKLATFDLTPDVLQAIKAGQMMFAIDQQPYLQGYLPIMLLTLYKTNLNAVANDVVQTGPSFITKDNVDKVIQLTAQGTR